MLPVVLCNKYENHKFMESYKCDLHGLGNYPRHAMFFGASLEITTYIPLLGMPVAAGLK